MYIGIAQTKAEISACFACMSILRPHLELPTFVAAVERMAASNAYQLIYVDSAGIKSVAGIRISEWLHTGKYLEIEELVTLPDQRSHGYGGKLFDWLCEYARQHGCRQVRLVSGVKRSDAHRFYERKGMVYEAKYFSLDVG